MLVILGSFLIKWPNLPVDPSTIAGAMYYVCDSWMLDSLQHTSTLKRKKRDWVVSAMGKRYKFGEIIGQSGAMRAGVDSIDDGVIP